MGEITLFPSAAAPARHARICRLRRALFSRSRKIHGAPGRIRTDGLPLTKRPQRSIEARDYRHPEHADKEQENTLGHLASTSFSNLGSESDFNGRMQSWVFALDAVFEDHEAFDHWPGRSASVARLSGQLSHSVSNRPIWLAEAADPVIARSPTTQRIAGSRHGLSASFTSSQSASRPNTDCRGKSTSGCRPFLPVLEFGVRVGPRIGQAERIIQLAIRQQAGVGGDRGAAALQQTTVEIGPQSALIRFTRPVPHHRPGWSPTS